MNGPVDVDDRALLNRILTQLPAGMSDERLCRLAGRLVSSYQPTRTARTVLVPPAPPIPPPNERPLLTIVYSGPGQHAATALPIAA